MGVTSKKGDDGTTEILFGKRVSKGGLRIEALGTLDEVNSFLGFAKALSRLDSTKDAIHAIQQRLFKLGAELAAPPGKAAALPGRVNEDDVHGLEQIQGPIEDALHLPPQFAIPGTNPGAAALDMARSVTRRFERVLVRLHRRSGIENPAVIIFVNRLGDLLFILARQEEHTQDPPETISATW